MPRFVLLAHQTPPGYPRPSHYDLMLEMGEALWTWAVAEWPPPEGRSAVRLPDHRTHYLDYEGPLSEGRGWVRRIDRGTYSVLKHQGNQWVVRLHGDRFQGLLSLEELSPEESFSAGDLRSWRLVWVAEHSPETPPGASGGQSGGG